MPRPVASASVDALARIPAEIPRSARSDTKPSSQSAPASGSTQCSVGMPSERAVCAEQRINAAAWSTRAYAFITFVYGKQIIRLSSVTVVISSGSRARGDHAYGFSAATRE